ncbi:MAG: hypothetical protein CL916_13705 [Deltaproteobacteria bacterium]|nr:hypothetical protein [Deltaproteobacteria bacterium]
MIYSGFLILFVVIIISLKVQILSSMTHIDSYINEFSLQSRVLAEIFLVCVKNHSVTIQNIVNLC